MVLLGIVWPSFLSLIRQYKEKDFSWNEIKWSSSLVLCTINGYNHAKMAMIKSIVPLDCRKGGGPEKQATVGHILKCDLKIHVLVAYRKVIQKPKLNNV